MMKRVHSQEVHYIISLEDIMDKLEIPNDVDSEYIGYDFDASAETFTFKQIERVK